MGNKDALEQQRCVELTASYIGTCSTIRKKGFDSWYRSSFAESHSGDRLILIFNWTSALDLVKQILTATAGSFTVWMVTWSLASTGCLYKILIAQRTFIPVENVGVSNDLVHGSEGFYHLRCFVSGGSLHLGNAPHAGHGFPSTVDIAFLALHWRFSDGCLDWCVVFGLVPCGVVSEW